MIPLYCRRSDSGEHVTQPGWRLVEAAAVAASLLLNGCSVERDECCDHLDRPGGGGRHVHAR